MRSGNPSLNQKTFEDLPYTANPADAMTLSGTVNKTGILLVITAMAAGFTWNEYFTSAGTSDLISPLMIGGAIGGFIVALITIFKKNFAPVTAPLYAALEGLFLGGISATYEARFPGIPLQAVGLTFGTLFILLGAYRSGLIKPSENFKLGIVAATGGIALVYLLDIILGMFGWPIPMIHQSGTLGIIFSLVVVGIAALNLVLDFDFIEQGAEHGAPKYMEWYGAFGLLVTLVWLYLELLRLLSKLQSRR